MVKRNLAAATAAALVLMACGGGGAGSSTSQLQNTDTTQSTSSNLPATSTVNGTASPSGATANTLVSSNGDLSRYLGAWKSGCEVRGGYSNVTATASSPASDPVSASAGVPAGTSTSASAGGTSAASPSAPAATPSIAASLPVSSTAGSITFYYGVSTVTFFSVSGNTLAAQSTDKSYEDSACTKSMSNPRDGTTAFTLTYLGNTALAPNAAYSGSADNVSISVEGSASPSTGYMAFDPGYGTLYTNQSTTFGNDTFSFKKQ